jgi:hypothetical protein
MGISMSIFNDEDDKQIIPEVPEVEEVQKKKRKGKNKTLKKKRKAVTWDD